MYEPKIIIKLFCCRCFCRVCGDLRGVRCFLSASDAGDQRSALGGYWISVWSQIRNAGKH